MTKDPVDFVRQGAFIALAMILIQQSEAQSPRVATTRELFNKVVSDKHEDPMARFGASLAQGILDAGGRNMTLSLSTRAGTLDMSAIVGMTLFVQFWYWYPLAHGLGLAFSPTAVIALDEELRIPKIDFHCNARPSTFAYPSNTKKAEKEEKKKAKTAVLSTTAKAKAREKSKKAEQGEAMDTVRPDVHFYLLIRADTIQDDKPEKTEQNETERATTPVKKDRKPAEPSSFILSNMSRVTPLQLPLISYSAEGRYHPIRPIGDPSSSSMSTSLTHKRSTGPMAAFGGSAGGEKGGTVSSGSIIMVRDSSEEEGEYIELDRTLWPPEAEGQTVSETQPEAAPTTVVAGPQEVIEEAVMPPPFEYNFDD